jgi:putative photosynthetic complex assembly protein 2
MIDYALPALFALLVWWAGTGVVLLLDRLPRATAAVTFTGSSVLAVAALACIGHTSNDRSVEAAYGGFACAMVLWGWHELAFLSGWVTGPRRQNGTPGAQGWRRLSEAVQVLLWHELALLVTLVALWAWIGARASPVAAWTFTLLYAMRVSAKLNLYLGVRNLALEFLPERLGYLGSYFRRRRFNALMPWSLVLGVLCALWILGDVAQAQPGARAARLLLASTLALALVEHLMMILPLQPSALWRWALKREAVAAR